jgi:hypothetical protein
MYSCACSLASNPIDLCTVMTCECSQEYGQTALLWASEGGHADTVRVLVELGASLEAVDKVDIHAHALAYTCCIKAVSWIMRMTIIIMISPVCVQRFLFVCICMYACIYIYIYIYIFMCICRFICMCEYI